MSDLRTCTVCQSEKSIDNFYKSGKHVETQCKVCRGKKMKVLADKRKASSASIDMSGTKKCTKCLDLLPKTAFSICTRSPDGLQPRCAVCQAQYVKDRYRTVEGQLGHRLAGSSARAQQKGLPFDLDKEFLLSLYETQKGLCAITGLPMEPDRDSNQTYRNPFALSVDRIDSNKGYTKDNVRLTTVLGNQARSAWSDQDVLEMSLALLRTQGYTVTKETAND